MKKGDEIELKNGMIVIIKTINGDIFGCEVIKSINGYKAKDRIIVNKIEICGS